VASDQGHTIRVQESAANAAGTSAAPALSAQTAIVQAPPTPPASPGPGPPSKPAPANPTGPIAAAPTAAQIQAALSHAIAPTGKGAKIKAILRASGYRLVFEALTAGQVNIAWYFLPPGAHISTTKGKKPVLVARGAASFPAAGTRTLKLTLTPAGKNLLKHAKRLKLTGKGSFTTNSGTPVFAKTAFTLRS
jgi:hypothetical protein